MKSEEFRMLGPLKARKAAKVSLSFVWRVWRAVAGGQGEAQRDVLRMKSEEFRMLGPLKTQKAAKDFSFVFGVFGGRWQAAREKRSGMRCE
jgi:hypothetical protein